MMIIDLKQLFELEGETVKIDCDFDLSQLELANAKPFTEPIQLHGKVFNRAGIVTLSYTATAVAHLVCDRCLAPINTPVVYNFEHILVKQVNDDDNDTFIVVPNLALDLDELASSDMILELPSKVLCKEACKGLCPMCGINLNENQCSCTQKRVDPRLEILSRLLEN